MMRTQFFVTLGAEGQTLKVSLDKFHGKIIVDQACLYQENTLLMFPP